MNQELLSNPRVSVIMRVYNAQSYLRDIINSVIAQTYSDLDARRCSMPTISPTHRAPGAAVVLF